jgi:hypothetical protein
MLQPDGLLHQYPALLKQVLSTGRKPAVELLILLSVTVLGKTKEKPQDLNLNFSFQDSYDMQGEIISKGNVSQF